MTKSYTFIGTSYLYSCEEEFRTNLFNNRWPGTPKKSNLRFRHETNLIQEVSKRNPSNIIYNCSEEAHGIYTYFKRILTLLDRYDPDVFVIEIPDGERILAHTDNEYGENYNLHFPIQIWEAGLPQNLDELYRETDAARIDECQVLMEPEELNRYWTSHTNQPIHLGGKQWQGYKQVLSNLNTGRKSRMLDVIAQCEIINQFLINKGKEVYWFTWFPLGEFVIELIPNRLRLLNPNDICQWKYKKDFGEIIYKVDKPSIPANPNLTQLRSYLTKFCYDKKSHLHSKYMPEFAEYFDEIFK